MTFTDPTLIALLFYSENSLPKEQDQHPDAQLAQSMGLSCETGRLGEHCYQGKILKEFDVSVISSMAHDTFLVRLKLSLPGERTEASWKRFKPALDDVYGNYLLEETNAIPWAISTLYTATVPANSGGAQLTALRQALDTALGAAPISDKPDSTPYGWLWTITDGMQAVRQSTEIWQRDLLLLIPNDRSEKVHTYFTDPLQQGFSRIELYLQKCKHHARQHEAIRLHLSQATNTLQQEMIKHLGVLDFSQIHQEPVNLERISQHLMRFLAQKAAVEILLNSLRNNCVAFNEHLGRVKLETWHYSFEKDKITRQIEQMESDLHNASVIQESTYAFQDIQRGAEASRFERASYLLGGTAALLAGISLFNSFLEIWSLALENSGLMMPAAWLRIVLSLIASISIPMAAAWLISRKKVLASITILISFAAIAAMIISTILINL